MLPLGLNFAAIFTGTKTYSVLKVYYGLYFNTVIIDEPACDRIIHVTKEINILKYAEYCALIYAINFMKE